MKSAELALGLVVCVKKPKVLIADDYAPMHEIVQRMLGPEFEVVSSVFDGRGVVDAVLELGINLMIVDIGMPGKDGIQVVLEVLRLAGRAAPCVVFLTTYSDPSLVKRALQLGAVGYVLKEYAVDHLVPAVRAVLHGDSYISPGISR